MLQSMAGGPRSCDEGRTRLVSRRVSWLVEGARVRGRPRSGYQGFTGASFLPGLLSPRRSQGLAVCSAAATTPPTRVSPLSGLLRIGAVSPLSGFSGI